jgi:hypothetical protein
LDNGFRFREAGCEGIVSKRSASAATGPIAAGGYRKDQGEEPEASGDEPGHGSIRVIYCCDATNCLRPLRDLPKSQKCFKTGDFACAENAVSCARKIPITSRWSHEACPWRTRTRIGELVDQLKLSWRNAYGQLKGK